MYLQNVFHWNNAHKHYILNLHSKTTQVWAHCAFVLKTIQNFVDLNVCKQLFVLNSYESAIKKIINKKS